MVEANAENGNPLNKVWIDVLRPRWFAPFFLRSLHPFNPARIVGTGPPSSIIALRGEGEDGSDRAAAIK